LEIIDWTLELDIHFNYQGDNKNKKKMRRARFQSYLEEMNRNHL